jgi:hypothetical protein
LATLSLTAFCTALEPSSDVLVGLDQGFAPILRGFLGSGQHDLFGTRLAFDPAFRGGVRVATGDVNGDGYPDLIAGAGPGGPPQVKVYDGARGNLLLSFFAFFPGYRGGVFVAAGDVNDDGRAEILVGSDVFPQPLASLYSGVDGSELNSFFFKPGTGGMRVALGDVNGDDRADLVFGRGPGNRSFVFVYDLNAEAVITEFYPFGPAYKGGTTVAAGDIDGDGMAEIIVGAGTGGGPHVRVFDSDGNMMDSFLAYDSKFHGGVRVAAGDLNGDGLAEILTGNGPGMAPTIRAFDPFSGHLLWQKSVLSNRALAGMFVAISSYSTF